VLDAVEGKWGVWVHQTQEMKDKKAQEIRKDQTQRADAIRLEAYSVRLEKKLFFLLYLHFYIVTNISTIYTQANIISSLHYSCLLNEFPDISTIKVLAVGIPHAKATT